MPGMLCENREAVSVPSGGSWWEQRSGRGINQRGRWVSVPSGGSWWEQLIYTAALPMITKFQYPLVGRGGSNTRPQPPQPLNKKFQYPLVGRGGSNVWVAKFTRCDISRFSTLWWVVVGATYECPHD